MCICTKTFLLLHIILWCISGIKLSTCLFNIDASYKVVNNWQIINVMKVLLPILSEWVNIYEYYLKYINLRN